MFQQDYYCNDLKRQTTEQVNDRTVQLSSVCHFVGTSSQESNNHNVKETRNRQTGNNKVRNTHVMEYNVKAIDLRYTACCVPIACYVQHDHHKDICACGEEIWVNQSVLLKSIHTSIHDL